MQADRPPPHPEHSPELSGLSFVANAETEIAFQGGPGWAFARASVLFYYSKHLLGGHQRREYQPQVFWEVSLAIVECRGGEEDSRLRRKAAIRGADLGPRLGLRPAPPHPSICAESTPAQPSSPSWAQRPTQESTGASPCSSCVHWGWASPGQRIHRHEKGNSLHSCSIARAGHGGLPLAPSSRWKET